MPCRTCGGKGFFFWDENIIAECGDCDNMDTRIVRFQAYQDQAVLTAMYEDDFYPIASLMIEAGELADLFVKPLLRGDPIPDPEGFRGRIISEAGDVLWNLAVLLDDNGISLEEVANYNIHKLERRLKNGTILGNGDR